VERRLAAILAADVVGYSRLMRLDEAATLEALKAHRRELIDTKIAEHRGRIFKLTGDGMLAEFPSVVNAVACAAEIQSRMHERNAGVSEGRRIEFRVGINVGDIIVEGEDILGDGVNVAARLEGIAPPGGIALSAAAREHIGNRLNLMFEDWGDRTLKNIDRPVKVFSVLLAQPLSASTVIALQAVEHQTQGKPSVAVLPFTNMSGDAEQEYFADGITEDIITDLSKVSGLSVIARNSVFTYKGKHADVQEVGRRFNVSTILEGSVRKAGNRVRINAQLIDVRDGTHLWADRYDRELTDIFAIQDEITKTIVHQLKVKILPREKLAIETTPTANIAAYDTYLKARQLYHIHTTPRALLAQRLFAKAVDLDPDYARAYAGISFCESFLCSNHHPGATPEKALAASAKALELAPDLAEAHDAYAAALEVAGRYEESAAESARAVELDPNLFDVHYHSIKALVALDAIEKAANACRRALEIEPDDFRCWLMLEQMYEQLGRSAEAEQAAREGVRTAERALASNPDVALPAAMGASAFLRLGDRPRALEWADRALTIAPDDPITLYNVACAFSLSGEIERALGVLERWSASTNATTRGWVHNDTDFDNLREDERFRALFPSA
jgi:adenylate cyclase